MKKEKLFFVVLLLMFFALFFMDGCSSGGGGGEDEDLFPASAEEISRLYDNAPQILESYFYEVENFGESSNPDTVAEVFKDDAQAIANHLIVHYKDQEIYNEIHDWGIYLYHGFMKDGNYLIFIKEFDGGEYTGSRRLFVNGEEVALEIEYPVNGIKEYRDGWLIFLCQNGNIRSEAIYKNWVMFNVNTLKTINYGDYGLFQ